MIMILQWLAVPLVRYAVTALGAVAIFGLWLWQHDAKVEARVETKIIERAVQAGKKAEKKAAKAHQAAAKPGAAERLRSEACRDC